MASSNSAAWRILFVAAAGFLLAGGPMHPRGAMVDMLADPKWVPSHLLMLAGFATLLGALFSWRSGRPLPERSRLWTRLAMIGTALQAVEMAVHTAAMLDHAHLVAGQPTPIFTTHLWLSVLCYPIFGITMIGFILATARDRVLASPWIAWLGILGAAGHGAAAPLTIAFQIPWAPILFPTILLFALWLVLAGIWPVRQRSAVS